MIYLKDVTKKTAKNIFLTYQLDEGQVETLRKNLSKCTIPVTIAAARHIDSIFTATPVIAFLNFAAVTEEMQQAFFVKWRERRQAGEKMPLTYVVNCQVPSEKMPKLFVNSDIFANTEKLRLILLQETKNIEGKGKAHPISMRIEWILSAYRQLMCNDYFKKGYATRTFYIGSVHY